MFLLDTSVLSHAQYSRQHPAVGVWLDEQESVAIPFPALLEVQQGIAEVGTTQPDLAAELLTWLEGLLSMDHKYPEINPEVARVLATLYCCEPLRHLWYTNPVNTRKKKPGQDLFIAAVSIAHEIPIATLNNKDFALIDRYHRLPGAYNPAFSYWIVAPPATRQPYVESRLKVA
ncbi:type II toxin-antitoxin system VapC family toxin [Rhizobium redzepovicii]|uniref:Type II toxin-antitoxin system VapC family toxin n=1 Tax=Rhizobium redzepovicii TaxID=2867518 RepID=A0AAW8P034_9HYPH|nr:type II toxin-antitoxin system VapC family toxin [Rhizobium redzepovicii]MDR9759424.1 type II toxin-antitoxin system VapC family toxin [Rhizobium redzepovicii]